MATYGYARVSTIEQADGSSIDDQSRKIAAIAMFRDEPLAEVFADIGVSGSVDMADRPQGSRLAAQLTKGDVLIVAKLDRAFRDAADALAKVKEWKKTGVKLVLADMGNDPVTENGTSKLFFTVLAGFAEWERDRIAERVGLGRAAKKAAGGHIGGLAPFGFDAIGKGRDAKLVKNEAQQAALGTIKEARDAGFSLRATADLVKQKHGVTVSYESIRRLERAGNGNAE